MRGAICDAAMRAVVIVLLEMPSNVFSRLTQADFFFL